MALFNNELELLKKLEPLQEKLSKVMKNVKEIPRPTVYYKEMEDRRKKLAEIDDCLNDIINKNGFSDKHDIHINRQQVHLTKTKTELID